MLCPLQGNNPLNKKAGQIARQASNGLRLRARENPLIHYDVPTGVTIAG